MAGRPQVSIRLGTTGRSDVERDFVAIGDSGEAQARRYQAAWERASSDAERAVERQAKAAARLDAVSATPVQQRINATTGVGAVQSGNAKAAASALAVELDRAEREARQLIAAIDPLFAAQARYEAQIERINAVRATGQLDEQRYQQLLANEKTLLDQATAAAARNNGMRGQMRMGAQQLGFQMNDVASQMAMGTRASVIFAQQSAQVVQALQLMGGEGNAFLRFLGGPWGIALSVAVVALTPFIGKLFEAGSAVDNLVEKMKKEAQQAGDNDEAQRRFGNTIEGVTAALRDNRKALDDLNNSEKTAARLALEHALAEEAKAQRIREATVALLKQREAELKSAQGQTFGAAGGAGAGAAVSVYSGQVAELQGLLKQAEENVANGKAQIDEAFRRRAVELLSEDKVDKIKRTYDDPRTGLIALAGKQAKAEELTNGVLKRRIELLTAERDAKIKAAQDAEREKKGPANAGGTAIFNDQIASFFDIANKYRGLSETKDRQTLKGFLGDVDPEKTAWCAAFVNAVLAMGGVHGTGSLAASSFLNFGKDDTKSPQKGDVVVVKSGASPSGQHVGFLQSIDKAGNVTVLGGNTGDKVGTATYSAKQVLAVRRPPTPAEADAAADRAASDAIQAQQAFDSEAQQLNQQYLQALAKVVAGYDAQASVQLMRAQGEHDAEAKEIASNLAAGKYGDATSQLAQSRAQQLQEANDQVLNERKAAVALESYVKSLQAQDATNEQDAKFKLDALQYSESIARTAQERRDLELQIIDIQFDEKKKHLEYAKALAELAGKTEEAARIQAEINNIPKEKGRAQDQANRDTQSPFEAYRDSLPKNMAEAGTIMQTSVVDGLKSLNAGLDDALMKSKNFKELWHNLGSVVHDVAQQILKDLIDLTIKMFILKPLMQLISGGSATPGFATGTEYAPGGMAWVGEHGRELVRLPQGSKVFTAAESRRMAANDAGPSVPININIDATGADAAGLARVEGELQQLRRELPGLVMETWSDANSRFMLRGQRK